eukprot:jgi/Botrbrau1/16830/Bobra.150_2s0054.1
MLGSSTFIQPHVSRLATVERRCQSGVLDGLRGKQLRVHAGLGENWQKLVDSLAFEKWAPRSSRTWRLGQMPSSEETSTGQDVNQAFVDSLNERIASLSSAEDVRSSIDEVRTSGRFVGDAAQLASISDDDLADSLNTRISDIVQNRQPSEGASSLSGQQLRDLVLQKYGKTYDLSIARRDIPGRTLVALNVMWTHLEQQSFPMTEAQFMDKMDGIAFYLSAWGKADKVLDFLQQPPKSQRGLPGRPVVGCAVSLQLDLEPAVIDEWFK